MASTDLATTSESQFPILAHDADEALEIVQEALGGDVLDEQSLLRVTIPAGGGTTWEIGDEATKELEGILVHHKQIRAYFAPNAEDGAPPVCRSEGPDHKAVGIGQPGGSCQSCPLAQFGSAVNDDGTQGEGQACNKSELWFLLRREGAGSFLPIVLKLSPMSLKPAKQYRTGQLASSGLRPTAVVTRITLAKQEKGKQSFSVIVPSVAEKLAPEEAAAAAAFAKQLRPMLDAAAMQDGAPVTEPDVED